VTESAAIRVAHADQFCSVAAIKALRKAYGRPAIDALHPGCRAGQRCLALPAAHKNLRRTAGSHGDYGFTGRLRQENDPPAQRPTGHIMTAYVRSLLGSDERLNACRTAAILRS
jgi:hypothetical protein